MDSCKRILTILLAAAFMVASAGISARAQFEILVFEFQVSPDVAEPWVGKALTDYTIRLLNSGGVRRAMPREEIRRLTMRMMPDQSGVMSFDNLEKVRNHAGSPAVIEGVLQSRRNGLDFVGTYIDVAMSDLRELSFSSEDNSFMKLADLMRQKLASEIVLENPGKFGAVAGTENIKAFTANWRGIYLYENGDSARALPLLEEAGRLDPAYVDPYLAMGKILLEKADLNRAAEKFAMAVKLAPLDPRGHFLLGLSHTLLRKIDSAETEIKKAMELYPDNPGYFHQLGVLYKSTFKYSDSLEMFRRAVALDPSIAEAWYELASVYSVGEQTREKKEKTLEYIRMAVKWGGKKIVDRMENDTDFKELKEDPEFKVIIKSYK